MKSLSFIALILTFTASLSGGLAQNFSQACADPRTATLLYRAFNLNKTDHFYTSNPTELDSAVKNLGYIDETGYGTGYVYPTSEKGTIPFYRMFNPNLFDHFYTISEQERQTAITNLGYIDEGIVGYVYPDGNCGGLPLWRLYSTPGTDHFYTLSPAESDHASSALGYTQQGYSGYMLPLY